VVVAVEASSVHCLPFALLLRQQPLAAVAVVVGGWHIHECR